MYLGLVHFPARIEFALGLLPLGVAGARLASVSAMAAASAHTVIDGAYGEGGGQILRNSTAYSMMYDVPVRIENIRANRPKGGGLRPQHVAAIRTVAKLGSGSLEGDEPLSKVVNIQPGQLMTSGEVVADPGTAGSTMLLAQAVLPVMVSGACKASIGQAPNEEGRVSLGSGASRAGVQVTLRGGTSQTMAPLVEFFQHALLPMVRRLTGVSVSAELTRRGYVPLGGGEVLLTVESLAPGHGSAAPPSTITSHLPDWHFDLTDRGTRLTDLTAYLAVSGYGAEGPASASTSLQALLEAAVPEAVKQYHAAPCAPPAASAPPTATVQLCTPTAGEGVTKGQGLSLVLVARDDVGNVWTGSGVVARSGKGGRGRKGRGKAAGSAHPSAATLASALEEALGTVWPQACAALQEELRLGGCVDSYLLDQLIVFAAMTTCAEPLQLRVGHVGSLSDHTRSAVYVANTLTPHRQLEITTRGEGDEEEVFIVSSRLPDA